ncbi:hypothetical protein A1O3_07754 [Capronia epimyces CBS 606.96]|uniref:Zn(2)-C6 fungal-type domain-containing protein n=1 Tax=Capronia epimyces CBS 606.96 TaxID=1182542 RepID=W9XLS0_9EURO|nr:uncharacterized protein A1O3_07754 [Capronia epimyces CBS 606.96]EXJ81462.1 hypothetical protein A1O3_07754 [Capronia epimyces CBS 606.96]
MARRRTGCLTCRKRKIKCDERRPLCRNCQISNRECVEWASGFQLERQNDPPARHLPFSRPLKFRPPLSQFQRKKTASKRLDLDPERDAPSSKEITLYRLADRKDDASSCLPTPFPVSPAERLAGRVWDLLQNGSGTGFSPLYFGDYFQELPRFIGRSVCLDAAVECFLLTQQRLGTARSLDYRGQLQHYGRALKLLRHELGTLQVHNRRTETLAASVVLLASEVMDNSLSSHAHLPHVDGASALMRAYGPDFFNSRFELQLFYSLIPIIVSRSLERNTECFVGAPSWLVLENKIPSEWVETRIEARILHTYTKIPTFLQAVRKWRNAAFTDIPGHVLIDLISLRQHLLDLGEAITDFIQTSGLMAELPCISRPPGPSTYYLFKDIHLAEGISIYFRMVILVTRGLSQLQLSQPADREWSRLASAQLCMSVEHERVQAPSGALFTSLTLKVARIACSDDLVDWIEDRLRQVEDWLDPSLKNLLSLFDTWLDI